MRITRNVPLRLGAFAVAALLAVAGGAAIGAAVGPIDEPAPVHSPAHAPTHAPTTTTTSVHGGHLGMSAGVSR